ncbi:hypothetical protein [Natrialba swarupiae]|uniref:DUF7974 domain-containing protein n=1 Tax=Natrialba swarupiae TaxID=2448032 RepID=A0A5D5AS35_9EURY|nr:hypothetical protein [Natrialba swarupiae]TYT63665.1 hypothetical protein FYC77_00085 [Natrialba swarupiae]
MVGPKPPGRDAGALSSSDTEGSRWTTATLLSALVPTTVARRAITVSVETDRDVYEAGDPVEITVEFKNRLPLSVEIPTPSRRRWGWSVDGELEATDERRFVADRPSAFSFDRGERKRAQITWNGRFERTRGRHESIVPEPGEYEIRAFVTTHEGRYQPAASTTIELE